MPCKPLLAASQQLDPQDLRRADGSIDLARLASTAPDLSRAQAALAQVRQEIDRVPTSGIVGPVAKARNEFVDQLNGLAGTVDTAYRAARVAPAMLGANGPRRYLMVFETPAESRGTGGLVGSYAIIRVVDGKVTREQTGSDSDLKDSPTPVVNLGVEFNSRYGKIASASAWKNANFTPHYPWAAEVWQRLWERQSGETIDGVISVDPIALGYMLDVTGPVKLSDGEVITGRTAATWSMVTSYALYPNDNQRRKDLTVELARLTLDRLTSGAGGSVPLLKALGRAAGEHRLLVWSARPSEEAVISGTPLAGELTDAPGPFTALVVRNASGDKLDYYLQRKLNYQVLSCGPKERLVRVTATLTNTAPKTGLPAYVTVRSDHRIAPLGDDRVFANIYATHGSTLESVLIDGKRSTVVPNVERGHPVYEADVELPIGKPQTVSLTIAEPRSTAPLQYLVQPLAKPLTLTAQLSCP